MTVAFNVSATELRKGDRIRGGVLVSTVTVHPDCTVFEGFAPGQHRASFNQLPNTTQVFIERDIKVWNRRDPCTPDHAVNVCRPTPFGNPYRIGETHEDRAMDRATVIALYRTWLMNQPKLIAKAKAELRGQDLVCWCAPEPCHADVLLQVANG